MPTSGGGGPVGGGGASAPGDHPGEGAGYGYRPGPAVRDWRFILGDVLGLPIASLTPIAVDRKLSVRLNRPTSLSFRVPSDHESVAKLYNDGHPRLDALRRTVRAYRREVVNGAEVFVCRFAGPVWQVQDQGDENAGYTSVTCFDPFQRLTKRLARGTSLQGPFVVDYPDPGTEGGVIVKDLVDRTNAQVDTGIFVGTIETTPTRIVHYETKMIGDVIVELASASNGFDVEFEPLALPVTPADHPDVGSLVRMNVYARRGQYKNHVVLGWAAPPRNTAKIDRLVDGEKIANYLYGIGGSLNGGDAIHYEKEDLNSAATFGLYEDVDTFSDVIDPAVLQALVEEELTLRRLPREIVKWTPAANGPRPFDDFDVGDSVNVRAGAALRGGFSGIQRVYGFDLSLDDVERVDTIATSPED